MEEARPGRHVGCHSCAAQNPGNARFCNQCGAALAASVAIRMARGEAERRQLTVMFSDLVGSTAMSRALDTEDYRDLLNEYQALCSGIVTELGGIVAQYLGDGVLVYFGYPEAHEDDPRRATQAALAIHEGMKSLGARLTIKVPVTLQARIGIHTGIVVVSQTGASHDPLALGEAPNLAARLQQLAEPSTVVVSEATHKRIAGYFETQPLGELTVKGFDQPVAVHKVLGATGAQSRLRAASLSLAPLVGRDSETTELEQQWESVLQTGSLRAVVLCGEPGIGKSHQAQALKQRLSGRCTVVESYCSVLDQNAVLRPIASALESAAQLTGVSDPTQRFEGLRRYGEELELNADVVPFLASVLSIPIPEHLAQATLTPQVRRQRTMQSLMAWLRSLARHAPVLLLIEDLQWADPSTLELLGSYVGAADSGPILLLATGRPEFVPDWPAACTKFITLRRLPRDFAERLIDRSAQNRKLPRAVLDRVIELTDGIPLYLEEVTKAILESKALLPVNDHYELSGALPESVVPATVQDSLMARLDRTGDSKTVAQLAAVLGREFSERVLRAVSLMDDAALNAGLRRLIDAELILPGEERGGRVYRFKHALIQETAYQSLLKSRRRQYHHRAASVLRDLFPEVAETQPHLIALHHARANLPELAIDYFERAGNLAFSSQAYAESINHFQSALAQLRELPEGKARNSRELGLLTALGLPLLMTKGYAATEVEKVYDRALALCTEVDPPLRVLFGIWGVQITRGDRASTERMAARFEQIAESGRNPCERLILLAAVGSHAFWCGRIAKAISALQGAAREFEPEMLLTLPRDHGYDNALYPHLYLSWAEYVAGRFEDAQTTWNGLWTLTERANTPYLTVMALSFGASIANDIGDTDRALALSEQGMALATEHQLVFWQASCQVQHGAALCDRSKLEEGMKLIEQGVQLYRSIGAFTGLPNALTKRADACHRSGATEKGLATVEEGLALSDKNLDRLSVPELLRLKAQLLLQEPRTEAQAEACFLESIEVAHASGGALWELRTATSYATWLLERGEPARAAQILDAGCRSIANGDAPVLDQARELAAAIPLRPDGSPTPEAPG